MLKQLIMTMTLLLLLCSCQQADSGDPGDEQVAQNIRLIQENLVSYARENGGLYPEVLNESLLKDGANETLMNPYTKEDLHPVAFTAGEAVNGNICYIAVHEGYEVKGYVLIGFGNEAGSGEDVDGDGEGDNVVATGRSPGMEDSRIQQLINDMK